MTSGQTWSQRQVAQAASAGQDLTLDRALTALNWPDAMLRDLRKLEMELTRARADAVKSFGLSALLGLGTSSDTHPTWFLE